MAKRSWEGLVLRVMGAKDFRLTVRSAERLSENYLRLGFEDGGFLASGEQHPTLWLRLWFEDRGRPHQRAYTVVDPDCEAGVFFLEFALHEGVAARWAESARPGDAIDATLQGSRFQLPDDTRRVLIAGDPAGLPAVNSLLDSLGPIPASVWLEFDHPSDRALPLRLRKGDEVSWLPRGADGAALVAAYTEGIAASAPEADFYWIGVEAASARALTKELRRRGVEKRRVDALGYWRAG